MMEPVLLSSEQIAHDNPVLAVPVSDWNSVIDEPPHGVDLELRIGGCEFTGFAHRRLLGGKLTFWTWIDGRCRIVPAVSAWRRKA